jgi:predicted anti-sigma-YlaC factor YlaD
MSDPSCRTIRELLGVYVVGAIEPGERAVVDAHLDQCYACREELAALAPLPALLHRVPLAEAERIGEAGSGEPDPAESSAQMLDALLKQVAARRRTRLFRAMLAAAAAVLIAVGGAAAVSQSLTPHPTHTSVDVATASSGRLGATVHYGQSKWNTTTMSVQVSGFPTWTSCKFWVITKDGRRSLAGGWIVGPGADKLWYPIYSEAPKSSVRGFEITWGSRGALQIPAR